MSSFEQLPLQEMSGRVHDYLNTLDGIVGDCIDPDIARRVFPEGCFARSYIPQSANEILPIPERVNLMLEAAAIALDDRELPLADLRSVTARCINITGQLLSTPGEVSPYAKADAAKILMRRIAMSPNDDEPVLPPEVRPARLDRMRADCEAYLPSRGERVRRCMRRILLGER